MSSAGKILAAREAHAKRAAELAVHGGAVTIKANVPGCDKQIRESALLVRYFAARAAEISGGPVILENSPDGFWAALPANGRFTKPDAVRLEESDEGGRFVDIDVYPADGTHSLTRGRLRRCYLCEKPAIVCARQRNHPVADLQEAFRQGTRAFISRQLAAAVSYSITAELDLEDKFGLVTPTSVGSHPDLNYDLMIKSRDAVIPGLVQMFWTGYDCGRERLLERIRIEGRAAEAAMYAASGGVNTYKGLVFVAGVLLASAGCVLAENSKADDIYDTAARICSGITAELAEPGAEETFGRKAYRLYGVRGARGQAEEGFPAVRRAEALIDGQFSPQSLKTALCNIVGNIEDTVLLKRSGTYEKYLYFKRLISSADPQNKEKIKILTAECIKNNISIGGSADLLIAGVLVKKIRGMWYFDE